VSAAVLARGRWRRQTRAARPVAWPLRCDGLSAKQSGKKLAAHMPWGHQIDCIFG